MAGALTNSIISFVVSANLSFRSSENPFLDTFFDIVKPTYHPPSAAVMSKRLLDTEVGRAYADETAELKKAACLTLLFDGWEDKARRSLYGSVAAQVSKPPTVLALTELTGHRGNADKYVETLENATGSMGIQGATNIVALTTDNPTVMQSFRRKYVQLHYWIIVRSTHSPRRVFR